MTKAIAPFFRSEFNYDRDAVSEQTALFCADESKTVQSQSAEADINNIVASFIRTGVMPATNRVPLEGDIPLNFDFQAAMDVVRKGEAAFMACPADVRARFDNDPVRFVNFCTARKPSGELENLEVLRSLGLAKPAEPAPTPPAPDGAKA